MKKNIKKIITYCMIILAVIPVSLVIYTIYTGRTYQINQLGTISGTTQESEGTVEGCKSHVVDMMKRIDAKYPCEWNEHDIVIRKNKNIYVAIIPCIDKGRTTTLLFDFKYERNTYWLIGSGEARLAKK